MEPPQISSGNSVLDGCSVRMALEVVRDCWQRVAEIPARFLLQVCGGLEGCTYRFFGAPLGNGPLEHPLLLCIVLHRQVTITSLEEFIGSQLLWRRLGNYRHPRQQGEFQFPKIFVEQNFVQIGIVIGSLFLFIG
ncbi:hypothetical protein F2Q69_00046238 [Brassica cretica]|uniref:Uncharacterized protein n=1 Tax=Brassica cretica TaxID=69181 RepID=A0A8S9PHB9_BRACR|nr:hypothetical protein F2Q69_00046238 [Brassica cretica]